MENCINAIKEIENGSLNGYFVEMSACEGSCINGSRIVFLDQGDDSWAAGRDDDLLLMLTDHPLILPLDDICAFGCLAHSEEPQ